MIPYDAWLMRDAPGNSWRDDAWSAFENTEIFDAVCGLSDDEIEAAFEKWIEDRDYGD